jgi:type I restriction enzyme S subunit
MYNIENGSIVWKNIKRMTLTNSEVQEYQLEPGDVLINRVNSRELVGKAAPIPEGLETCVYESKNIRLRLLSDCADSRYVGYWLGIFGQRYFSRNAQQVVGMASINQDQIGAMPFPLAPLAEQRVIAGEIERCFSIVEAANGTVERNLKYAEELRSSILKRAFEGKLLPQEPNDEPANMLLERITTLKTAKREKRTMDRGSNSQLQM